MGFGRDDRTSVRVALAARPLLDLAARPLTHLAREYTAAGFFAAVSLTRKPGRTSLTVATLAVGFATVIWVWVVAQSFERSVTHVVHGYRNAALETTGSGANVLGDPRVALAWMANEWREFGETIRAGQFVTTGTCIVPISVEPGDEVRMDFGVLGSVGVRFSDSRP